MPELSRFYGIIIRMFMETGGQHHRPHFHAYYGDEVAIFSLSPIELIAGSLPRRQQKRGRSCTKMICNRRGSRCKAVNQRKPSRRCEGNRDVASHLSRSVL